MAGNHPDEWDTAAQWEWPQWQDSNRWEWQANDWWHRGQWDNGSEWRHWDRPAIPAPEDQEETELSQPLIRNLSECGAADIEAIRRRATIQAWESWARSDPATPETAVAADEQPVLKRLRFNGIPAQYLEEHPIPYKAAPTGKESEAHHSGVQVKAAPAGVPFKAAPAGVPLIRWPCKAPPQGVKPPQPPGVDQLQRVPYKVDVRPPHACGGILMGATPSFDSNTFLISSTASPSTHNTFLLAAGDRSLEVLQEASSSSGNIQCFLKNWMPPPPPTAVAAYEQQQSAVAAYAATANSPSLTSDGRVRIHTRNQIVDDSDDVVVLCDIIQIEFKFISGEDACRPLSIMLDTGVSCGHLWMHLLDCGLDMENKQLVMGNHTLDVCMKLALLKSVREQLQATPGLLRITVVHAVPNMQCND